jgi:chromosome partitioning protein
MTKIIAIANHKGGVGKTTTAVSVGAALALMGKKVLLIDMDAQANLTISLGIDTEGKNTTYKYLKNNSPLQPVRIKTNLYAVPSDIDIAQIDIDFMNNQHKFTQLSICLESVKDSFDYIFIDCPPVFGIATINGLTAADELYITMMAEGLSVKGLRTLVDMVSIITENIAKNLKLSGVIITRYDNRKTLNREVVEVIRSTFKDKVFNTLIRENVSLAEAPLSGKDILAYSPKSRGAEDYCNLAKEIIEREKTNNQ